MNTVIISPLFPDVQLTLSETDLQNGNTFEYLWHKMDTEGKYDIGVLEVEVADLQNRNPSVFPLSTPIPSLVSLSGSIFSIDLKAGKIGFKYKADPIMHFDRYGFVRIAESSSKTALDIIKYIVRRHSLLLKDENIEIEGIDYQEYILKEEYKEKNPYYCSLYDLWMGNTHKKGLLRIEITSILGISAERNRWPLSSNGKVVNNCTSLGEIFVNNLIVLDGCTCEKDMSLKKFFLKYHEAKRREIKKIGQKFESFNEVLIQSYREKAERMTRAEAWKTFFSMLKPRIEEYSRVQLVWPRKTGKTQMAFNLCLYCKVIYIDFQKSSRDLRNSFTFHFSDHFECYRSERKSKVNAMIQSMIKSAEYHGEINPTLSEVIDCKDEVIGMIDILLQYLANFNSEQEDWMTYLNKARFQKEDIAPMSIAEFQTKYPQNVLRDYVIFLDNGDAFYHSIDLKFYAIILGFKVVTTSTHKEPLGRPLEDVPVTKWCSVSRKPLNFIPEASNIPFDKDLLLNRFLNLVNGEENIKSRFFSFMLTQISSSFAGVGLLIAKNLIESLESEANIPEKISFREWRDKLIQKIIADFEMEYAMSEREVVNTLFNPWYDRWKRELILPNSYFYIINDEPTSDSPSSGAPFLDIDKKDKTSGTFLVNGQYEKDFDEGGRFRTTTDFIPWNCNHFSYLYMFSVLSKGYLCLSMLRPLTRVVLSLFINYSHCSLKNGIIEKTHFLGFIKSYITGLARGILHRQYKLNIPTSLRHLIASVELAFLSIHEFSWNDAMHEAYPEILGSFKRRDKWSYYFDYYDDGYPKQGILVKLSENEERFFPVYFLIFEKNRVNWSLSPLVIQMCQIPRY